MENAAIFIHSAGWGCSLHATVKMEAYNDEDKIKKRHVAIIKDCFQVEGEIKNTDSLTLMVKLEDVKQYKSQVIGITKSGTVKLLLQQSEPFNKELITNLRRK